MKYLDELLIEFDNCFGKILRGMKGSCRTCPRYTKIKAKRAAKIERYIWRARGINPMYAYSDTTDTNYWSDDDN